LIKNFLARVGCLSIIALTALGAWHFRGEIAGALGRVEIEEPSSEPSDQLARQAEEKLLSLSSTPAREISFSEAELQSLLTFRVAPNLPDGIEDPRIQFQDTMLVLSALLRPDQLDRYAAPEMVQQFFSDTARVAASLLPGLRRPGTGTVTVASLQAGPMVVPSMMVPFVLQSIEIPGFDASGADILVPVPARVSEIDVVGSEVRIHLAEP
jgi:hypothetical protein